MDSSDILHPYTQIERVYVIELQTLHCNLQQEHLHVFLLSRELEKNNFVAHFYFPSLELLLLLKMLEFP